MSKKNKSVRQEKHPWRKCASGYHWRKGSYVDKHIREGSLVKGHSRRSTCVKNFSHKDQIYQEEMEFIANKYFKSNKKLPSTNNLGFKNKGNNFDEVIAGWTLYWNEVIKPVPRLEPNIVKAFIASESGFKTSISVFAGKRAGQARGLMQVTDQTVKILKDEEGELLNYLINVNQSDMKDANLNIAAGIRWLMRKKELADWRLKKITGTKRKATWTEAIAEFKGYFKGMLTVKSYKASGMKNFTVNLEKLNASNK